MIYTKRIASLLLFIILTQAYKITVDKAHLPKDVLDNIVNKSEYASNQSVSIMNLFPYKIYYHSDPTSNHSLAKGYLFMKNSYDSIEEIFQVPNITEYSQDEQQILYGLLPEVILIQPEQHEIINLELLDSPIDNHIFIISSRNSNNSQKSTVKLHFHQLQTHTYLYEITRKAVQKLRENSIQEKLEQYFLGENPNNTLGPHHEETKTRDKFMIYNLLSNNTSMNKYRPVDKLLYFYYNSTVRNGVRWRAISDGLHLRFFSASVTHTGTTSTLELVSQVIRAGSVKSNITIVQPLSYFRLEQIAVLDICSFEYTTRLLLSDRKSIYVIEIGSSDWHLYKHIKNDSSASPFLFEVFLGRACEVFQVVSEHFISELQENNSTTEIVAYFTHIQGFNHYPKKKLTVRQKVVSFQSINHEHILLCWQEGNCSLYETSFFNQLLIVQTQPNQIVKARMINSLQNMAVSKYLQVKFPAEEQLLLQIQSENMPDNMSFALAPSTMYDLHTYLNRSAFISRQMDKVVLQHITNTQFMSRQLLSQAYDQIYDFQQGDQQYCHSEEYPSSSLINISYNQTSPWTACVFDIQTAVYLKMRFIFSQLYSLSYRIYLCSYESKDNPDLTVDCMSLVETNRLSSPQLLQTLHGGYYYKLYLVKQSKRHEMSNLPTIFIKDVEKQQIEIASTIFFYIMLTLSLLLVGAIVVVIMRNVIASILIYYGHMEDRIQPTYPLPWFAHRTKLKRLKQIGVLRYAKYQSEFTTTDQGNHCCFCLQLLKSRSIVAVLFCGHEFHKDCFNEWIKNEPNTRCPTCRRAFTRAAVEDYHRSMGSNEQLQIQ